MLTKPVTTEPTADYIGGFLFVDPYCAACKEPLRVANAWMADGCPCNSSLGVNNNNGTRWRFLVQLQRETAAELARCKEQCKAAN